MNKVLSAGFSALKHEKLIPGCPLWCNVTNAKCTVHLAPFSIAFCGCEQMGLARKSELKKNQLTKHIVFNSQNVHFIFGMLVVKQVFLPCFC